MIKRNTKVIMFVSSFICSLFVVILACIPVVYSSKVYCFSPFEQTHNVILFIGDGMGDNHINVGETYLEREMIFQSFPYQGKVGTNSKSLTGPTDSAAAATAMATGHKVKNSQISMDENQRLETISEYAKSINKGVGIVTTDNLYGATPAGFSSHALTRSDKEDIIQEQIKSKIDLFLGAGLSLYPEYENEFINQGYQYINDFSSLPVDDSKLFGVFSKVKYHEGTNEQPTLTMLTEFAIEYMQSNFPQGYFLMIEGAHIDKRSHSNNILEMIKYLDDFEQAISLAYQKIDNASETAIIVTADHETGGIKYQGEPKEEISDEMYSTTSHTSTDVNYYIYFNTKAKVVIDFEIPRRIDNTDIFRLCQSLLS